MKNDHSINDPILLHQIIKKLKIKIDLLEKSSVISNKWIKNRITKNTKKQISSEIFFLKQWIFSSNIKNNPSEVLLEFLKSNPIATNFEAILKNKQEIMEYATKNKTELLQWINSLTLIYSFILQDDKIS